MKKEVKSLEELRAVARELLQEASRAGAVEGATVIGLSGDLGAGKTAFVKCIASILGIEETITSPTFILEKVYIIPRGSILGSRFAKLIHIDAYRLESGAEMRALGWEAISSDPQNLILIEWPEQVAEVLPSGIRTISFAYVNETTRELTM